jgi:hypothetical protein
MALRSIKAFGSDFDLVVNRQNGKIEIIISVGGNILQKHIIDVNDTVIINLEN